MSTKQLNNKPRYQQIAQHLRRQIQTGALKPGDRLPSFTEMNREHAATTTTVNQVLGVLEKEGLIAREKGRGVFVASPNASQLTGVIGCFSFGFTNKQHHFYWSDVLQGVRDAANEAGRQIMLFDHEMAFKSWEKIDGVLVTAGNVPALMDFLPPGMPTVSLISASPTCASIRIDDRDGMRQATTHLLELGHRRIAVITAKTDAVISRRRLQGYHEALAAYGITPDSNWIRTMEMPYDAQAEFTPYGKKCMAQWLGENWGDLGCTALLAHNDQAAVGAIEALHEAGLEVPSDVNVVGFDGTEIGVWHRPQLTSVQVPLHEVGRRGVELLLRQIDLKLDAAPEHAAKLSRENVVLPASLIVRQSTQAIRSV